MTNALITGANKGIGFAVATQLGRSGVKVLVGARDGIKGEEAVELLREQRIDAEAVALDVTDPVSVRAAATWVWENHGLLDILVNNAGVLPEAQRLEHDGVAGGPDRSRIGLLRDGRARLPELQGRAQFRDHRLVQGTRRHLDQVNAVCRW